MQERASGNSYNSTFMSAALLNAVILDPEIRVLLVLDGSKSTLDQIIIGFGESLSNDGSDNIIGLILSPFEEEFFTVLGIKILPGQKVFNDGGSRFAKSVREDGAEGDVGDGLQGH